MLQICIVLTIERRFASSHVSSDDEVGAAVVLSDNHVLDGL